MKNNNDGLHRTDNNVVNLLWTGGWDSTFRLLYLLIVKKSAVQPYYIIDSDRLSTGMELRVMKDMKRNLFAKHPRTRDLLRPTEYREMNDIQPNEEITQSYKNILGRVFFGSQYDWLARFVHEIRIDDMEICVMGEHPSHKNTSRINLILKPFIVQAGTEGDSFYVIDKKHKGTAEYVLFRNFRFPLLDFSKADLGDLAKKEGFLELMDFTWFCHRPRSNGTPCGVCNPCLCTIRGGLSRRIPLHGRVRYYFRKSAQHATNRMRQWLARHPRLYGFVKKVKAMKCFSK